jgi:hypothetical protein
MSISSFFAAKIVGEETGWNTDRSRLHKLLFITHLVYSYRNNGEPFIDNEPFIASNRGPLLRKLDQHIECYGAKPYQNLFRRYPFNAEDYSEEIKIIKQAIDAYKGKGTHQLSSICHGLAWSQSYTEREFKHIIPQKLIYHQSVLELGKKRNIVVEHNGFVDDVLHSENLSIYLIDSAGNVSDYSMTTKELKITDSLMEDNGIYDGDNYLPYRNKIKYFKKIDKIRDLVSKILSYENEHYQHIFFNYH